MNTPTRIEMDSIRDVDHLEELLSEPAEAAVQTMAKIKGDVIILGVGGKMGPSLARMVCRATRQAGVSRRVIGVSRFSSKASRDLLEKSGVETLSCDLLDEEQLAKLPDAPNVIYMAGMKFGSTGNEPLTWAMNAYLPGPVCRKFRRSRIVAFSTGNVYGLSPVSRGGSVETDMPNPQGDYAMSCLGRERMFCHFASALQIPLALIRLNYAVEMRYGVLVDIAQRVWTGEAIDLAMGYANVIWQGDANAQTIQCLEHAATPPLILNMTGPELLSVRDLAEQFAAILNRQPKFTGSESLNALLSNSSLSQRRVGRPGVPVQRVVQWVADWVRRGGPTLNKPTHFETRDGKF